MTWQYGYVCVRVLTVKAWTDLAILCVLDDLDQHWIPRSQIASHSQVKLPGDSGVLIIPKWLAVEDGIPFSLIESGGPVDLV